jgi:hypothetical protein
MSNKLMVMKDNPIGFWTLDSAQNGTLKDFSGCNNDASYSGIFDTSTKMIPLSLGGQNCLEVNSDNNINFPIINGYYQNNFPGGFGTVYYGDNDFTLECWIYPKIYTDKITKILGDASKNIGIFYKDKNIIFKLDQESLEYNLPYVNKSIHIVCVYLVKEAHIYIDGILCISKNIEGNPFTNTQVLISSGPTSDTQDTFLIDDVAIYRYGLPSTKILDHYLNDSYTSPAQISQSDNGEIFEFYDTDISKVFSYSYPFNRSWQELITEDLYYDQTNQYIQIKNSEIPEEKSIVLEDTIFLPAAITMNSSKIDWFGDSGVTVETSTDGINYFLCSNGESIPQYNSLEFNDSRLLNIRITISSEDISKYLPKLYNLNISFYNNQIMYSKNGSGYLSKIENLEYYLGSKKYSVVSRDLRNGILSPSESGFKINLTNKIKSIEFFYTPFFLLPVTDAEIVNIPLSQNNVINAEINPNTETIDVNPAEVVDLLPKFSGLILQDSTETEYYWDSLGNVNKDNIDSIYVNSINVTSETNISNIFKYNNLYHVVINLTEPVEGALTINHKSNGSVKALYQYMSFYQNSLDYNKINDHYKLYTSRQSYQTSGSSITLSENSVNLYNNDWLVIQNS